MGDRRRGPSNFSPDDREKDNYGFERAGRSGSRGSSSRSGAGGVSGRSGAGRSTPRAASKQQQMGGETPESYDRSRYGSRSSTPQSSRSSRRNVTAAGSSRYQQKDSRFSMTGRMGKLTSLRAASKADRHKAAAKGERRPGEGRLAEPRRDEGRAQFRDEARVQSRMDEARAQSRSDYSRFNAENYRSRGAEENYNRADYRTSSRSQQEGRQALQQEGRQPSQPAGRQAASASVGGRSPQQQGGLKRGPRFPKPAFIAAAAALVLALVGGTAAFGFFNNISSNLNDGVDQKLLEALVPSPLTTDPFYMVLMGTDGSAERDQDAEFGGSYRSDSLMLVRVDPANKKVAMISIGRDTIVDLGKNGQQKINAAYGFGGAALVVETVSNLANVPVSHFAQVDFDGFSSLVDALGGVEVNVPVEINDWEAGGSVSAGNHVLNGTEALVLCRSRNTYIKSAHPDEMRAANQRMVMGAIAKKILNSEVAAIANSISAMSEYITTDLSITDIITIAQAMQGLDPASDIYTAMAPTNSDYVNEVWCEYIDKKAWSAMIARVEKGLPPTEEGFIDDATGTVIATAGANAKISTGVKNSTVTVKNSTERDGLASGVRTKLMGVGFKNVVVGDVSDGYEYPQTLIVYDSEVSKRGAEQIAELIGQGQVYFNDGSYRLGDTDYLLVIGDDWRE